MIRFISILFFIGFLSGKIIDDLEIFFNNDSSFLFKPEKLHKIDGLWYSKNSKEIFTGRFIINFKNQDDFKIIECTIVDGLKNGIYIQYYNQEHQLPGIIGLYVEGRKQGTWILIEDDNEYLNDKSLRFGTSQIITSIDYRDGMKHGSIIIHKTNLENYENKENYFIPIYDTVFKGQYFNGEKKGDWYFYDPIYTDLDLHTKPKNIPSTYWSRKEVYDKNNLIDQECKEPWDREINCDDFKQKYFEKIFFLEQKEKTKIKKIAERKKNKAIIKDRAGVNVEIDIKEFVMHIKKYHYKVNSIHKERGYSFLVSENLRKMLYEKSQSLD